MSLKEIDNKLKKIKRDLTELEKELNKEKIRLKKSKNTKSVSPKINAKDEWEKLRIEVTGLWDGKMNSVEEIRAQRNRD
ncbi:MAG: hypothetical protein IPM56_15425 [Ignavibacteriales bacterium]|nr:MAG: hypothetical protein IPM56_15425 [Ignavibacteriales bacterium]